MRRVYLDNNATTPLSAEVKKAMVDALDLFGNASSMHGRGREARMVVEQSRTQIAQSIDAKPDEIIFTSGGSEANNMVLNTIWGLIYDGSKRKEIIISAIEHPSILEMAKFLASLGFCIHYLPVDKFGQVKFHELEKVLNKKTLLVSVMLANNETGAIQDVKKVATMAKQYGALVHTDAVQAVGKIQVDAKKLGVDYLTMSAHKFHGPKGIGALYVREGAPIVPLIMGGHQELGKRAGTTNNLGIISFSEAAKNINLKNNKVHKLRDYLLERIQSKIENIVINTPIENSLPNTLNISFLGAEGESILLALDAEGIEASTGSACASGSIEPSYVLMAQHNNAEIAHGSVRFSLGDDTTKADIDYVIQKLPPIIEKLRSISTIYNTNSELEK